MKKSAQQYLDLNVPRTLPPRYYVYVITDPRTGDPLYVGKGYSKRMRKHWRRRRQSLGNSALKAALNEISLAGYKAPVYEKWFASDDEDFMYFAEITVIAFIGKENLCNASTGGRWTEAGRGPGGGEVSFSGVNAPQAQGPRGVRSG